MGTSPLAKRMLQKRGYDKNAMSAIGGVFDMDDTSNFTAAKSRA